jgi:hypothetical protein
MSLLGNVPMSHNVTRLVLIPFIMTYESASHVYQYCYFKRNSQSYNESSQESLILLISHNKKLMRDLILVKCMHN